MQANSLASVRSLHVVFFGFLCAMDPLPDNRPTSAFVVYLSIVETREDFDVCSFGVIADVD